MADASFLDAIDEDFGTRDERLRRAALSFFRTKLIKREKSCCGGWIVSDKERVRFYNLILLYVVFGNTKLIRLMLVGGKERDEIINAASRAIVQESEADVDRECAHSFIETLRSPDWDSRRQRLANPFRRLPLDALGMSKGYYHFATAKIASRSLPPDAVAAYLRKDVEAVMRHLPEIDTTLPEGDLLRCRILQDQRDAEEFDSLLDQLLKK